MEPAVRRLRQDNVPPLTGGSAMLVPFWLFAFEPLPALLPWWYIPSISSGWYHTNEIWSLTGCYVNCGFVKMWLSCSRWRQLLMKAIAMPARTWRQMPGLTCIRHLLLFQWHTATSSPYQEASLTAASVKGKVKQPNVEGITCFNVSSDQECTLQSQEVLMMLG